MENTPENGRFVDVSCDAKDVIFAVNPKAGAGSQHFLVEDVQQHLQQAGLRVVAISDLDSLEAEAAKRLEAGTLRAVVAGGGDGTVSLVVNRTPIGTPIAVLPLGTENLLARYLQIRPTVDSVCIPILAGRVLQMDAGLANGRLFLLMIGCGFDAEVVRRIDETRTGHITHWSYAKPILSTIRSYQYPQMRVYSGGDSDSSEQETLLEPACWVFVLNLPCYARRLAIAPGASGTDGVLDAVTFRQGSLVSGLRYLTGVLTRTHQRWKDCQVYRSHRYRIEADAPVPYQVDGDAGGFLPLEIEVLPGRLRLLVQPLGENNK